jgi:hypothetical protein
MSDPAIISGDFSTFRHVQGRKVLQLVIEIPAEQAASVFSTFGYPGSGNPIPVAVARLNHEPIAKPDATEKTRTPFLDLPLPQQAAMRCNELEFWSFLRERGANCTSANDAARYVRLHCAVGSRSEITEGMSSGDRWKALEGEYFAHSRGRR